MNPDPIRYALAVVDEGSFSAAARALSVTQPTISNAVTRLEERLGAPLFRRSTRSVELTAFGLAMLSTMRDLVRAHVALQVTADAYHRPDQPLLRLGFSPIIGARALSSLVASFQAGDSEVVYKECSENDLSERLGDDRLDVVIALRTSCANADKRVALGRDLLRYIPPGAADCAADTIELSVLSQERIALTAGACGLASATRAIFSELSLSPTYYSGEAMSYPV
ncbi:MAG: DNA-binding transcriptional LysR family regulator, partial [Polyangiales bacterium]